MDLTAFQPYLPNISDKTGCLAKITFEIQIACQLKKITKNYIFIFINIRADDSKNFTVYIIFQKNEKLLETVFSKIKKKKSKKKKEQKELEKDSGNAPLPSTNFLSYRFPSFYSGGRKMGRRLTTI